MATDARFTFAVEPGDILSFEADLVAFKYAQGFHGADKAAAGALAAHGALALNELHLAAGEHRLVNTRGALKAPLALFIGMPSLDSLGYAQIREFGERAAEIAVAETDARRLAMTLHGVGVGLDEVEAFLAQIAGCNHALISRPAQELRSVTIVERDVSRVMRLTSTLQARYPVSGSTADGWGQSTGWSGWGLDVGTSPGDDLLSAPLPDALRSDPGEKLSLFVAMPFTSRSDELFHYVIQKVAHEAGFLCERIDHAAYTGDVLAQIKERIANADLVIAELSETNANVYLEIGFAWGQARETVLLLQLGKEPEFDVAGQKQLRYRDMMELEELLSRDLKAFKERVGAGSAAGGDQPIPLGRNTRRAG